eukprot:Skav226856  [mRNA]  locus=scaffold455:266039:274978:- [translate_table: standard]
MCNSASAHSNAPAFLSISAISLAPKLCASVSTQVPSGAFESTSTGGHAFSIMALTRSVRFLCTAMTKGVVPRRPRSRWFTLAPPLNKACTQLSVPCAGDDSK